MANCALQPVSQAIFARLNVASLTGTYPSNAGCIGGVHEFVPQAPAYPFLLIELFERDLSGLGSGPSLKQLQLRLHVFSQYLGMAEAQRIMTAAIGLVQFHEPTLTGWNMPRIGRPNDVVPIEASIINGVACRELVSIWDELFADEVAA